MTDLVLERRARDALWLSLVAVLAVACENAPPPTDAGVSPGVDGGDAGVSDGGPRALDPTTIPQFVAPLVIPPAMPPESSVGGVVSYEIAARQLSQQVLPAPLPPTHVWGYGRASDPGTDHSPGFTVETRTDARVRVTWVNGLVDASGHHLPHLLPIETRLHWANPGAPASGPSFVDGYDGPVPIVTHVHGAHVADHSDGNPEAWYLPDADDIPTSFRTSGSHYHSQADVGPGRAVFEYANDQPAATLWYHDHALGITRLNVWAGLAGFWLVRDAVEDALDLPGPAPTLGEPAGTAHYEIPIAIQDRSFSEDGSLRYPATRIGFDEYDGPFAPETPVLPTWNPEVFGNAILVNGHTWPFLEVEPRLYRFRFLNGCNARFLILRLDHAGMTFHQIGGDQGLLSGAPVERSELLMAPAERADVLVDFSALAPGDTVMLTNVGPDEPYRPIAEGEPPLMQASPETTGRILLFRVVAPTGAGHAGSIPTTLPVLTPLTTMRPERTLTLNERSYDDSPTEASLGTGHDGPMGWDDAVTEELHQGDTEIWQIANLTGDSHPIHLHLVAFQVLDRTPFDADAYADAQQAWLVGAGPEPDPRAFATGTPMPPEPWERGPKDTVVAHPGQLTRLIATFDLAGLYVWHCHILEHEDNEMMRPYRVLPPATP